MHTIECPRCQVVLAMDYMPPGLACPDCGEPLAPPPPALVDDVSLPADDALVLEELERQQTQQTSWTNFIVLLVISLFIFTGLARTEESWTNVAILVGVLFVHELGHYVAMRLFGYRNLKMFFIPMFGAAVSGRHYNIAGWKKALVALAGPLPGIWLAVPMVVAGALWREPILLEVALWSTLINGFNLLPFFPLDGGWVVHAVLFVRHPVLDVVFRVLAGIALLIIALLLETWILGFVAVMMLLGSRSNWQLADVAHRLRERGGVPVSPDANRIPPEAALPILAELRKVFPTSAGTPANLNARLMATYVTNVFENLNATPPGILASIGLLALHGLSFLAAVALCVVMAVLKTQQAGP